ncbi:MAG: MBL fold metallo-hydrolase [Candidatus Nanopelagicales bacterium]
MSQPWMQFLGHASVLVELGGLRILTDPVLRHRVTFLRRVAERRDLSDLGRLDAVVISHMHHDHVDVPSLRLLPNDVPLLVPQGSRPFFTRLGFTDIQVMPVGRTWQLAQSTASERAEAPPGLRITATPADHVGNRTPFSPRTESIGYLLESGPASVYFAGDTDIFEGMSDIHPSLDVALLPVWGWGPNIGPGHLNPERAAEALCLLRPRYAVPIHWGTLFPLGLRRLGRRVNSVLERPPLEFVEAAARTYPECRVLVTRPGEVVEFTP